VSALLVLAILAVLGLELARPRRPPDVQVQVESMVSVSGGYLVRFRAHNLGTETAASLQVEGELLDGHTTLETSSTSIDYLPGGSVRRGGLFFRTNPAEHQLRLRPGGFVLP